MDKCTADSYKCYSRHVRMNWKKYTHNQHIASDVCFLASHLADIKSYPLTQWEFLSGVGPLWFSTGCSAFNINKFFPLAMVHARR